MSSTRCQGWRRKSNHSKTSEANTAETHRAKGLIVLRLPPEVLCIIFEYIAFDRVKIRDHSTRPYRPVFAVSQVCRCWRNIALNSQGIWGCIYADTPKGFVEMILGRAKSAPLYIRQAIDGGMKLDTMELLIGRLHQCREIELYLDDRTALHEVLLQRIAYSTSPMLEKLVFGFSKWQQSKIRFAQGPDGCSSPLRHLELCVAVELNASTSFPHLRTLKLSGSCLPTPTDDMLLALQNMPHLVTLELNDVLSSPTYLPHNVRIACPNLTTLRIFASQSIDQLTLITRLSCPSIQTMHITCIHGHPWPEEMAPLASSFYALIPSVQPWLSYATVLPYHPAYSCKTEVMIWLDDNQDTSALPFDPPFQLSVPSSLDFQAVRSMLSLLPTGRSLVFQMAHRHSFYEFGEAFSNNYNSQLQVLCALDNVVELGLESLDDLLLFLSDTPEEPKKDQPTPMFSFPRLSHIVLDQQETMKHSKRKLLKLGRILKARKALGVAILTLMILANGHFDPDDVRPLEEHVSNFELK